MRKDMLYTVIRLIFALAAGGIAFVMLSNARDTYVAGRRRVIRSDTGVLAGTVAVFLAATVVLSLFPVENAVFGFKEPENAFRYNHTGEILEIDEYDGCALIVASTGDERVTTHVLPCRSDGRWLLETIYNRRRDVATEGYCIAERLHVPGSDDCFVIVARSASGSIADDPSNVTDSRNTRFQVVSYPDTMTFYYGYVPEMDDKYVLYVDGEKLLFHR